MAWMPSMVLVFFTPWNSALGGRKSARRPICPSLVRRSTYAAVAASHGHFRFAVSVVSSCHFWDGTSVSKLDPPLMRQTPSRSRLKFLVGSRSARQVQLFRPSHSSARRASPLPLSGGGPALPQVRTALHARALRAGSNGSVASKGKVEPTRAGQSAVSFFAGNHASAAAGYIQPFFDRFPLSARAAARPAEGGAEDPRAERDDVARAVHDSNPWYGQSP
jgi:hypothetical protein